MSILSNELRFGNYVQHSHEGILKVCALKHTSTTVFNSDSSFRHFHYTDLDPIPLTAELLEKCGFEKEKKPMGNDFHFFVFTYQSLTYNSIHGWWIRGMQMDYKLEWVHQLQNLYFALTQKELPINL